MNDIDLSRLPAPEYGNPADPFEWPTNWPAPADVSRVGVPTRWDDVPTLWVEGVTPTWSECPHGVVLTRGTYLRSQVATGDHPDCLDAMVAEEQSYEPQMEEYR